MNFNSNLSDEEVYSSVSLDLSALEKLDEITQRLTMDALKESEQSTSKNADSSFSEPHSSRNIRSSLDSLTEVSDDEMKYRLKLYPDTSKVLKEKIRCTSCAVPLLKHVIKGRNLFVHPILQVLICQDCRKFYGDGNFPLDDDNSDTYCRWCAQGGSLYCCSACSFVFCKPCIRRNFKHSMLEEIEEEDWKCFACNPEALWKQRAICWAAKDHNSKCTKSKSDSSDEEPPKVRRRREDVKRRDASKKRTRSGRNSRRKDSEDENEDENWKAKLKKKRVKVSEDESDDERKREKSTRVRRGTKKEDNDEENDDACIKGKKKGVKKDSIEETNGACFKEKKNVKKQKKGSDEDSDGACSKQKRQNAKEKKKVNDEDSDDARSKEQRRSTKEKKRDSDEDSDDARSEEKRQSTKEKKRDSDEDTDGTRSEEKKWSTKEKKRDSDEDRIGARSKEKKRSSKEKKGESDEGSDDECSKQKRESAKEKSRDSDEDSDGACSEEKRRSTKEKKKVSEEDSIGARSKEKKQSTKEKKRDSDEDRGGARSEEKKLSTKEQKRDSDEDSDGARSKTKNTKEKEERKGKDKSSSQGKEKYIIKSRLEDIKKNQGNDVRLTAEDDRGDKARKMMVMKKTCLLMEKLTRDTQHIASSVTKKAHQFHMWISEKNNSPRKQYPTTPIKLNNMMANFRKLLNGLKEHAEEIEKKVCKAEEEWMNVIEGGKDKGGEKEEETQVNSEVIENGKEKDEEMEKEHIEKEDIVENESHRVNGIGDGSEAVNGLNVTSDGENMEMDKSIPEREGTEDELDLTAVSQADTVIVNYETDKTLENVNEKATSENVDQEECDEAMQLVESDKVAQNEVCDVVSEASNAKDTNVSFDIFDDAELSPTNIPIPPSDSDEERMEPCVVKDSSVANSNESENVTETVESHTDVEKESLSRMLEDEVDDGKDEVSKNGKKEKAEKIDTLEVEGGKNLSRTTEDEVDEAEDDGSEPSEDGDVKKKKSSKVDALVVEVKKEKVKEGDEAKEVTEKIKPSKDDRDAKLEFLLDSSSSEETDSEKKHNFRNAKKKNRYSDSSDSDSDTSRKAKTVKRKQSVSESSSENATDSELISQFHDKKLKAGCSVIVKKLDEDEIESIPAKSESKKKKKTNKEEDDIQRDIRRLSNLRSLEKSKPKYIESDDSDSDDEKKLKVRKKEKEKKKSEKSEKKKESSEDDQNLSDEAPHVSTDELELELKTLPGKEDSKMDELAKKMLIDSSDSDVDLSDEENKEKSKAKKKNADKSSATVKKEKDDEKGSDSESDRKRSKKSWRNDKLLREKLSETDSSEEERKWKAKKEKNLQSNSDEDLDAKAKSSKTRRRRLASSSSDEIKLSSGNSSSDSSSVQEIIKKRKRVPKSDSSEDKSSGSKTKKKQKRRRIKTVASDSDSDEDEKKKAVPAADEDEEDTPNKGRKNIRKVLKGDRLGEETKQAAKTEEERKKRIAERQKLYNDIFTDSRELEVLDKLVLDFDPETKKELVSVNLKLVKKLKPHQAEGIKFMWDACFESLKQMETEKGSGCILAHCMGLGKTLQVVALVHTLLHNPKTKVHTVLVICPLNTVLNWVNEFKIWLKDLGSGNDVEVYELSKYKGNMERMYQLKDWQTDGGVMVMGYDLYRNLLSGGRNKRKKVQETFQSTLADPGPDLVICDEGHLLKNIQSALSKAVNSIKTARRIVLTGTPLQNNLKEYHCMIQFVKPSLLGTYKEFLNRFVNPISNGQCADSTPHDVRIMKRRAHVLHKMLDGCVQRRDYAVLTPFLPPKHEYVICICLTELQSKLYCHYLEHFAQKSVGGGGTNLFNDFNNLHRIWTHPRVLKMSTEKEERRKLMQSDSEGSLKDFIDDETEESDTTESSSESSDAKKKKRKKMKRACKEENSSSSESSDVVCLSEENKEKASKGEDVKEEVFPVEQKAWWESYVEMEDHNKIIHSGKLMLLLEVLQKCELIGDKVLVFSQSLYSLNLIEYFLEYIDSKPQSESADQSTEENSEEPHFNFVGSWEKGIDYFRIDGSVSGENRNMWCKSFNREDNVRARLFLISTRAGGIGINLVGANRVILFDASWNPSSDLQSIFRIYRFGQKKPCYVYRFLAQGTMEEKIYNRQVTKLSLASRVLDEHQIERHFNFEDLQELYTYEPTEKSKRPTPILPKDRLLAELIQKYPDLIFNYHEHDSLLENIVDEELTEEERKAAWDDFENEKKGKPENLFPGMGAGIMGEIPTQMFGGQMVNSIPGLMEAILKNHPNATQEQLSYELRLATSRLSQYFNQSGMQQQQMFNHMAPENQMQRNMNVYPGMRQPLQGHSALLQAQYGYQNYYHSPVHASSSTDRNQLLFPTQLQNNAHHFAPNIINSVSQQRPQQTNSYERIMPKAHNTSEGNGAQKSLKIRTDLMPSMSDDNDVIIESVKRRE